MVLRINMKRFSVQTAHDLRSSAARSVLSSQSGKNNTKSGDIIARIIGDSARISTGLNGILVHLSQNSLLYIGICVVFLYLAPMLGLFFLVGGLISIWIGFKTLEPVAETAGKQRAKEGALAASMQQALSTYESQAELDEADRSSAKADVKTTKLITISSLKVYMVLALTVGAGLWYGAGQIEAGRLDPGVLFLFIIYAMTVHRRIVQVGRQIARSGKVLANADRIGTLLDQGVEESTGGVTLSPLSAELRIEDVKLPPYEGRKRWPRLKTTNLVIKAGDHVAIIGGPGDGKSNLLRLIAGREKDLNGTVTWDGIDITKANGSLYTECTYTPQEAVFTPIRVWQLLGLSGPDKLSPDQEKILKDTGIMKVITSLPKGLNTKIGSSELSRYEAMTLKLGSVLLKRTSMYVLDSALEGLTNKAAKKRLISLLELSAERTLVIGMSRALALNSFDHVIVMRRGKVRFNGSPKEYYEWKLHKSKIKESKTT
ncbi:MAG: ABC transporter ATP-binding protein, partial [Deltaproteobacteria bacterium]|nr:ABC transporter ATP-binding protein [Deltaproteobacteria bacterium]